MINIRSINKLTENDGFTLKNGKKITHKTGYQVATEGIATRNPRAALAAVKKFGGNCGVWLSQGIYYVDRSHRVATKKEALAIGRACYQQSVLKWSDMSLVWC